MSLLQILYTDHKFLWSVIKWNPSVDNHLCSTPQKRCEYVLKISWKLEQSSITWLYVLKALWRHLCKTYWRCLEDVFKTPIRRLEAVLKKSWRRLEDVLKTSWRWLEDVFPIRLEDVLKTSWKCLEDVWPRRIYWSWSRRLLKTHKYSKYVCLEDVFWRRRQKTFSRRLHQDECLLGYLLNYSIKANLYIFLVWFWVSTAAFLINFLGKSLVLNFPKMQK